MSREVEMKTAFCGALLTIAAAIAVLATACGGGTANAGSGPLPTDIDASKLTSFTRPDGLTQSAFDGHPLYYFAHDAVPGDINGRGGLQGAFDLFNPSAL